MPQPGPITLTRGQYRKTAAGRKPSAGYGKYLSYLARNRPARIAQNTDPLRALTEGQIRSRATTDVRSQVDPVIAEIRRSIGGQAKAGMGAIGGYTNQLASQLGGYADKAKGIYGQAQQSQAGSDAALSGMLSGQGNELAAALSAKLGAAGLGQPLIDKTTGEVAQTGAGSAGALYGAGSASLSNLISQGAGAQNYAAKLPGIARLGGLQSARELQLSSGKEMSDRIGEVTSQVPGITRDVFKGYRGAEIDKQITRLAGQSDVETARIEAQTKARETAADRAFELKKLGQQQRFDSQQSALSRDADLAAAEREYGRSKKDTAATRRWEAKQAKIGRDWKTRQAKLDRKAAAKKAKAASNGSLVP